MKTNYGDEGYDKYQDDGFIIRLTRINYEKRRLPNSAE